ncbi:MAG: DUF192 domain-containing protein [Chloroflexota bacterium]|nr:DUF192 domain-containing protein [Chloroflexota bacterium]
MKNNALQIDNLTRSRTIVSRGRVADSFLPRLVGLMGSKDLADGQGLLILPCNSIHSHFMRFPIDVLYVSRDLRVVAVDHGMQPWRFGRIHRDSRFVVELPAGTAAATGTEVGDQLALRGYEKGIG